MKNTVKSRREKLGLTQDALAEKAKVGRVTISNAETGKYIPGVDIAIRLAHALDCSVEDLFIIETEVQDG